MKLKNIAAALDYLDSNTRKAKTRIELIVVASALDSLLARHGSHLPDNGGWETVIKLVFEKLEETESSNSFDAELEDGRTDLKGAISHFKQEFNSFETQRP